MTDALVNFDTNPGNVGVRITVHNEVDGTTTDLLFKRFPVRIGRNKLNDLVLSHQYVSSWHAVLGFVRGALTIAQVGSSNAVTVGDKRLGPNEDAPVQAKHPVRIVPFTLYLQLMPLPDQGTQGRHQSTMMQQAAGADASQLSLERVALQAFDRLARRFAGQPIADPQQLAAFASQLEQVLDVFLRCFVALQKGQSQFRQALDIKALGDASSWLNRAADAMELSTMLLSRYDQNAALALEASFKDIMIHQVALLNGLMAGVKTLIARLSPERVQKEAARRTRSPGWRQLWETFGEIHRDLAEEDNEAFDTIFGKQFSKAYASLVGGQQTKTKGSEP